MAADSITRPILETARTPSDFIQAWGLKAISAIPAIPTPDTLREVERALHAVQEFLVEPIVVSLKRLIEGLEEGGMRHLDDDERPVGYEDVGRLIAWTDELRSECGFLLGDIADAVLLSHEDLATIAGGFVPDMTTLSEPQWKAHLLRFHGLDRVS